MEINSLYIQTIPILGLQSVEYLSEFKLMRCRSQWSSLIAHGALSTKIKSREPRAAQWTHRLHRHSQSHMAGGPASQAGEWSRHHRMRLIVGPQACQLVTHPSIAIFHPSLDFFSIFPIQPIRPCTVRLCGLQLCPTPDIAF